MRPVRLDDPPSPYDSLHVSYLPEEGRRVALQIYEDASRTILSENKSPDVPFRFSVNPDRGCVHACAYCYARRTHEHLGFGGGADFDRRIVVKRDAPQLLREAFERRSWQGDPVAFSGVTDCYQPLEATFELTRQCIEVCLDAENAFGVITKSALIERDVDLLAECTTRVGASVMISIPLIGDAEARIVEPLAASPTRRFKVIERLARSGVDVGVMVAPVIPGLGDADIPLILERAREAGASHASWALLRLAEPTRTIFQSRMQEAFPKRHARMFALTESAHGGKVYDSRFYNRGRGTGPYADAIATLFETTARRLGFSADERPARKAPSRPRRAAPAPDQLELFSPASNGR